MARFEVDAVVEDEQRQPEDPEGVLGAQFVVLDVYVELFGEAMDREGRERSGRGVDVGQVVARVHEVAAAGEHETTAGSRARLKGGGEAGLREREADADLSASVVPVGGVDPDVDRFVVVGEGSDPPADGYDVIAVQSDRVDAAADPP